jgi:hypothetical protein
MIYDVTRYRLRIPKAICGRVYSPGMHFWATGPILSTTKATIDLYTGLGDYVGNIPEADWKAAIRFDFEEAPLNG